MFNENQLYLISLLSFYALTDRCVRYLRVTNNDKYVKTNKP